MRSLIVLCLLSVFCIGFAACAEPPAEEVVEPAALEQKVPDVGDVGALQTCIADCNPPTYNGVPVSCTASSCTATVGSVTCNGVITRCVRAIPPPPTTCAMDPNRSCEVNRDCDSYCGGRGAGRCNTSTACCVCL